MPVDRSQGATVMLGIVAGIAAAALPILIKANSWQDFSLIESSVVLASKVLVIVRQKA